MRRFAASLIDRLQATRLQLLDVYGHARRRLRPHSPAARWCPCPFAVRAKRQETADTWTLELEPPGAGGLAFAPGQFTMLSAFGAGEVPISISGDPGGAGALVHTVRAVGLATEAICAPGPGEVLGVRGPFGTPWPVAEVDRRDVVVVAGGIGLAPLRPAILALLARRERYGRLVLLYGGRSPDQLLYTDELEQWARRGPRGHGQRRSAPGPSGSATSASSRG